MSPGTSSAGKYLTKKLSRAECPARAGQQDMERRIADLMARNEAMAPLLAELTASNQVMRQLFEAFEKNQATLQRFRTALDYSADAIFLVDRNNLRFIDVNQTACERLGYSPEMLLKMGPQDISPYFNKQMLAARLDEIIASPGRSGVIETFHKHRDGSIFPVEVRVRAIESEGRTIMAAVVRDISLQRQNEEALRQSEEQFRQITENLQHMLWIGEVQSERFVYVSPAFENIWGRSLGYVYSRPRMLLADIHPEDRGRMTAMMQGVWRDKHTIDEEYRLLRKDGGIRWLWTRTFPIRDEKGRVYRIGAVTEDITARKENEENLRFSEEKYRRLFEGSPIGIALVSPDYRMAETNPAFCRMLGYSTEEMAGKTFPDITHPEDRDTDLSQAGKLFSGEIPSYSMEKRYIRKDGSTFWIKLHGSVVRDRDNHPMYGLGMVEDIDKTKRAETIRLAHEAAQKNALVREVHHRIKNHLQGVVGLLRRQRKEQNPCNAILEETIAQINTVAMVHGLQGKTLGEEIDLLEMITAISCSVNDLIHSSFSTRISSALEFSLAISRDESVPLALALNELLVNARKFGTGPVDIELTGSRETATLRIINPIREPPQAIRASGLELVKALLQTEGAAFSFVHGADRFTAEVCLTPPVLKI